MQEKIIQALNWRYAVKIFDPTKKVSEENMHTILESARLSPSVQGFEMWKFIVVENPEVRKRLREVGFDQPKITDASHLIVVTYRNDAENMAHELVERNAIAQHKTVEELKDFQTYLQTAIDRKVSSGDFESWSRAQTYIALGFMIETASLLGVDNGPMEGFQPDKVDEVLGLKEKNLKSVTMLALGYRGEDPAAKRPKVRRAFNEVIEFIK